MPKSKAYSNPLPSLADEQRYGTKCHELRAKIREIERENQNIQLKILQSKKNVSRLRIERSVLYEALATITANAAKAEHMHIPIQAEPSTCNAPLSTSNPNPAPSIPSPHNGYHPQSIPPPSRAYNEPPPAANNHGQGPKRSFNRSTEPVPINGITGLLNSNNNNNKNHNHNHNSHHGPPPPIPHSQYPQNLPAQTQVPSHNNPRISPNTHQLAPISADPAASARFSSASDSPTAPNNHFPQHHQLGARSMSVSAHHHHSRYPSPHHHHHHHHHRHPSEHARSNPASTAVLPSLRPHPPTQPLLNGNGPAPRVEGRVEGEGAEEEAEGEEDDGDEEEEEEEIEEEEVEGSAKDGSTSIRQVDDEMEIDAECEEEE